MKYANDRGVQFTVLLGETELENKSVLLKNMSTGKQIEVPFEGLINSLPVKK